MTLAESRGVFVSLRDPAEFAKVYVHPEPRTEAWTDT
jgi:hypothetical protein